MKRISLLLLCLCAAAWTSGCCHSHYSRCGDWDENCESDQPQQKRSRSRRCRSDKTCRNNGNNGRNNNNGDDCCSDCCNSCCGESGVQQGQSNQPMTYDGGAHTQSGCASGNCGSTTMSNGMPMYSGNGYGGNGGMPFPPGEGWTIQSTTSHPVGNEPFQAPGSTPTPITPSSTSSQGWSNPSSVPNPAPVPPPVSYNR